jgi:hypothetical protein
MPLSIVVSALNKLFKSRQNSQICIAHFMLHCTFSYIPHFNQQNALIKAQQNITQNTSHVRYQLLRISAKWCHPQGVKNNKGFVSPKCVVVVVVVVVAVVIVVVTVEVSSDSILSCEIKFVVLGQDITNNFGSTQT